MKVLYPDLVWGAVASSGAFGKLQCMLCGSKQLTIVIGVTHASIENWEYMEIVRRAADLKCSGNIQLTVEIVDSLLANPVTGRPIKGLFGLADLEHNEDFMSLLEVRLCCFVSSSVLLS